MQKMERLCLGGWGVGLRFGSKRLNFSINLRIIDCTGLFRTEVKPYWWGGGGETGVIVRTSLRFEKDG